MGYLPPTALLLNMQRLVKKSILYFISLEFNHLKICIAGPEKDVFKVWCNWKY